VAEIPPAEEIAPAPKKPARAATASKKKATKGSAAPAPDPEAEPAAPKAPRRTPTKRAAKPKKGDGGPEGDSTGSGTMDAKLPTFQTKRSGEVTIALERGQDVIVQVTRESYSSKGVRVSTKVSLPGRFLVLLPLDPSIGVSRKVQQMKERRRLRRIATSILPEGHGCIIRTNAQNKDGDVIRQDLVNLIEIWRSIEEKLRVADKPQLLYRDQSVANTVMRDLFTPDISRVVIDNRALYRQIKDYVEWAAPALADKVELHTGVRSLFDETGIEKEIDKIYQRRVWLPSGGYLILDQTEAMMVIDVNSGRYADSKEQELNSLRTNMEAAREIARQLRLRDIGGLIVVDFIDLYSEGNRKKVYDEIKREMRRDRAKAVVLPMTQFGLVQMTRQRIRAQVLHTMTEPCPVCTGSGLVMSKSTVARRIERWLQRFKDNSKEFRLMLRANPTILDYLTEGEAVSRLTRMMLKYFVRIKVVPDDSLPIEEFHFFSQRHQIDVTDKFLKE
jgi:ribonuclease G